ncbi:unnamed protein product [Plutella xylostella]|uniref:(diamondback moth) hypothetical protein n=1 Tax=Plutella xylostella TaxID=51655 RepID=A0A8S4G4I4_PLUXY|nr:unnamed protein product [Plutella xylostella]
MTNLPEENGENPMHLILSVASKLGVDLHESDVVSAERVGARNRRSRAPGDSGEGAGAGAGAGRPRPLVVRLTRRAVKDELMTAARVRRGATSADLGQSSAPRPIYVNERLTKTNRQLFYKVREAGRRESWRFLWTKKGRTPGPGHSATLDTHWLMTLLVFGRSVVDKDGFILVEKRSPRRRNRNKRGTAPAACSLKAATPTVDIYVSRVHANMAHDNIMRYIKERSVGRTEQPVQVLAIERLQSAKQTDFKSFRLRVPADQQKVLLNKDFWPAGIVFRRYRGAKKTIKSPAINSARV